MDSLKQLIPEENKSSSDCAYSYKENVVPKFPLNWYPLEFAESRDLLSELQRCTNCDASDIQKNSLKRQRLLSDYMDRQVKRRRLQRTPPPPPSPPNDDLSRKIPAKKNPPSTVPEVYISEHLLATLVAPFLADRTTFDNFSLAHRVMNEICKLIPAPWPSHTLRVDSVVQSVTFSPSGRILASCTRDAIRLWDRQSGSCKVVAAPSMVTCIAFSPDGKYLASGHRSPNQFDDHFMIKDDAGDGSIVCLWDTETLACSRVFRGHEWGGILSVDFSPDGTRIASGGVDQTVRIWNISDGESVTTLQGHSNWVYCVKFSPDGKFLASVGEDETDVWLWDMGDFSFSALEGHTECVHCVDFTPDGKYLVSGSDDETIRLWDMKNGYRSYVLEGNRCSVWTLACSPDSKTIVSGSRESSGDRVLRVWSIEEMKSLSVLRGHQNYITSIAYSPSGRAIASGGFDHVVRTWNLASEMQGC